jgi:hypothetical protein
VDEIEFDCDDDRPYVATDDPNITKLPRRSVPRLRTTFLTIAVIAVLSSAATVVVRNTPHATHVANDPTAHASSHQTMNTRSLPHNLPQSVVAAVEAHLPGASITASQTDFSSSGNMEARKLTVRCGDTPGELVIVTITHGPKPVSTMLPTLPASAPSSESHVAGYTVLVQSLGAKPAGADSLAGDSRLLAS